jgi:hypothetical protein
MGAANRGVQHLEVNYSAPYGPKSWKGATPTVERRETANGEGLNDVPTVPDDESHGFLLGLEAASNGMLFYPAVDLELFHCRPSACYPRTVSQDQLSSFLRPGKSYLLCGPQRRIEACLHGFLVLRRSVRPSLFKVCNIKAQSPIKKPCHDSLKTSSVVERTKHLGRLFGLGSPHELWLFIRREAQASFRKMRR